MSWNSPLMIMPALLNKKSICPNFLIVVAIMFETAFGLLTLTWRAMPVPPWFVMKSSVLFADSMLISTITTVAPFRDKYLVISRPRPDPAPVMIATLFLKFFIFYLLIVVKF